MTKSKKPASSEPIERVPVAGIGASAGGIEALRAFFEAVPADLGLAYVVVVHLAPDHESDLAAILSRCTSMSVTQVDDHSKSRKPAALSSSKIRVNRFMRACRGRSLRRS